MSKRKRINDAVYLFRLPSSLVVRLRQASKRYRISAASIIRTAIDRLLLDLAAGKGGEITWR